MDESDEKQWSKRYNWAECPEPHKTELDAIGSQWIEGALSHNELAFEAVRMLSELEAMRQADDLPELAKGDNAIVAQIKALTEAMLAVSERPQPMQTLQARRQALDFMRNELKKDEGPAR